jgi:UDP:flavonoid glycosyltransferase YjiC (YdhE family)
METNARVAWSGTGISLRTDRPRPKQLGCAVRSLLADPSYRRRAEGMSEAFAAWPGLERAVAAIAAVAGAGPAAEPPGSSEFTG